MSIALYRVGDTRDGYSFMLVVADCAEEAIARWKEQYPIAREPELMRRANGRSASEIGEMYTYYSDVFLTGPNQVEELSNRSWMWLGDEGNSFP